MKDPSWSYPPQANDQWFMEEIKNGVVVSKHPISRPCTYFGRALDEVQIPTPHPSCSRVHARVAFDKKSVPYLQDLNSGNGTIVNKKAMTKGNNEQLGLQLYPGDVVQLAASSRIFCLIGPSDFDRVVNIENNELKKEEVAIIENALESSSSLRAEEDHNNDNESVSWGIDMKDFSENDNAISNKLPSIEDMTSISQLDSSSMTVPPQCKKIYEKFMTKKNKLCNIQLENERISKKSIEGLSAGQEKQLEKNRLREVELTKEIQDLYQSLMSGIQGDGDGKKSLKKARKKKRYLDNEYFDDDDFYDKTKKHKQIDSSIKPTSNENESESQASLSIKWNTLLTSNLKATTQYEKYERKIKKIKEKLSSTSSEEEKFFIKNDIELVQDSLKKCAKTKAGIEKEVNDVEKLLLVINNKFVFDRDIGVIQIDTTKD